MLNNIKQSNMSCSFVGRQLIAQRYCTYKGQPTLRYCTYIKANKVDGGREGRNLNREIISKYENLVKSDDVREYHHL